MTLWRMFVERMAKIEICDIRVNHASSTLYFYKVEFLKSLNWRGNKSVSSVPMVQLGHSFGYIPSCTGYEKRTADKGNERSNLYD